MSLENASPELQLAVDLIYLLECNEIDPATALAALDIVKRDYQEKLQRSAPRRRNMHAALVSRRHRGQAYAC